MPNERNRFSDLVRTPNLLRRSGPSPNVVELASEKVEELVKSFEHVNEILDGFRYKQEPILLILRHSGQARTFAMARERSGDAYVQVTRRSGLVPGR